MANRPNKSRHSKQSKQSKASKVTNNVARHGWMNGEPKPELPAKPSEAEKPKEEPIAEKMLDISDGDYLLESLREFRPPSSKDRPRKLSIFEPGKRPEMEYIGGTKEAFARGNESFEELKFFERPDQHQDMNQDSKGFQRLIQQQEEANRKEEMEA